jgi:plastocyanin
MLPVMRVCPSRQTSAPRSRSRRLLAVSVVAEVSLAILGGGAEATVRTIEVTSDPAKCDKTYGPPCYVPGNGTATKVRVGDTVNWWVTDGTHTVTPVDPSAFSGSEDLRGPDGKFSVTFDAPGAFTYYCRYHGRVDEDGKTYHGMWGRIDVAEASGTTTSTSTNTPTSTTTTAADSTTSTTTTPTTTRQSPVTTTPSGPTAHPGPPPAASPQPPPSRERSMTASVGEPPPSLPSQRRNSSDAPPTRAADPGERNRSPAPRPTPPSAAIQPPVPDVWFPGSAVPSTVPATSSAPPAPQGDAVAILDHNPARQERKALVVTLVGISLLGFGSAAWKFAHRSSKYWPA